MFDIAYEHEATITACDLLKEKLWNKILNSDLTKTLAGFAEMMQMGKLDNIKNYHEIFFKTHGE